MKDLAAQHLGAKLANLNLRDADDMRLGAHWLEDSPEIGVQSLITLVSYYHEISKAFSLMRYFNWSDAAVREVFLPSLKATIFEEKRAGVRCFALEVVMNALLRYPNKGFLNDLFILLLDDDLAVRRLAVRYLSRIYDRRSVPYFILLLEDTDEYIQEASQRFLGVVNTGDASYAIYKWMKAQASS